MLEASGPLASPSESPGPRWRFRPRPHPPPPVEERRRLDADRRSCLRVAAALGLRPRVRWSSGPHGGASVAVPGALGASWFHRSFAPLYGIGQWIAEPHGEPAGGPVSRYGTLARSEALPLPFGWDRPAWADVILQGLAIAPAGIVLDWELAPGPIEPSPVARGPAVRPNERNGPLFAGLPPTLLERTVRDLSEERLRSVRWTASLALRAGEAVGPAERSAVENLVRAGTRLEGGNAIRFVGRWRGWPVGPPRFALSEPEVAALLPSPWARCADPEAELLPGTGLALGRGIDGTPVRLPFEPSEGRHLLVLGETGMGKSTLLVRLLSAARGRASIVLVDPIGDTGRKFLAALDPSVAERTTWVSPTSSPLPLNALDALGTSPASPRSPSDRARNELVMALRRVRGQRFSEGGFWGPRVEEVLGRALDVAARLPGGTLVDAYRLLTPEGLGREPPAGRARGEVHALRSLVEERPEEVGGARRVLGEVAHNRVLVDLLCTPGWRFDLARCGDAGAVTVLTGEAGEVGESTARYLGAIQLALLWPALLARPRAAKVVLALDEAQWFAHEGLLELLRLGRRGNVHVWTATQSLRSLPEELREALVTNCADFVLFRGDPEDARLFGRWSGELTAERLLSLPRGHAALLVGKGSSVGWAETRALRLPAEDPERLERVAAMSRARWAPASPDLRAQEGTPGPPLDPTGAAPGDDRERRALVYLRDRVRSASAGDPLRLPLELLRQRFGFTIEEGRRLGSEWRRLGILTSSRPGGSGPVWEFAPAGDAAWSRASGHAAPAAPSEADPDIRRPSDKDH